jgi:hypothetical protein
MKIDGSTLTQLLSSLDKYNPVANELIEKISKGLLPVAMLILSVLMYIEFSDTNKRVQIEQGRVNMELFFSIAWKYFVGFILVIYSDEIFDSIVRLANAIGNIINKVTTDKTELKFVVPEISGKLKTTQKMILNGLNAIAHFFNWFAEILAKILVFLRAFELFLFNAFAKILVAAYVSDEWRPVATGFIKKFMAVALQGCLIILILKLYPALMANDMFSIAASGNWLKNLSTMFVSLLKSGVFILVLIGSQRKAKEWMGG